MLSNRKNPGKSLETLVSTIERVLGHNKNVSVQSPAHLPDKITGDPREHDVLITITGSHHRSTIAIECRDRSRKVTVNDIEGFWSKCQDTGVDQGIVVSPKGFSRSAIAKAAHRSIRCLQLSETPSFNWLMASGIKCLTRMVKHTNWTLYPEVDQAPPATVFTILTEDGNPVDSSMFVTAAFKEFQKIPHEDDKVCSVVKRIVFQSPGLHFRNDATGATCKIVRALADVQYEVIEEFVPFRLISYSNSPSGELITDAAIADVNLGGNKGKIMIVYKENEGGQVMYVADRENPA
jgi:hypothetical protein